MEPSDFSSLGLSEFILKALSEEGYARPTPIQAESIRPLLEGRDLLGIAQTGTGKTAAFALPLIQRLVERPAARRPKSPRVLVVAPTRELAAQIDASFAAYGRHAELRRVCVFGGVGSAPQEKALAKGVDVLVATPGRLLDLADRGFLNLSSVEAVVLDEADRMFDMGFIKDIRRIVALLPAQRQTIMFSATMPPEIAAFADPLLKDPVRAAVPSPQPTADRVEQKVLFVSKEDKKRLLCAILEEDGFRRVIVFTRTKHGANRLAKQLEAEGINSDAIHANKSQNQRTRAMDAFRSGGTTVLVATDLAARGIDVDDVELVVNYDLPNEPETYVHRIGRTARAGQEGVAVSFCDSDERPLLRDIERFVGFRIPVELDHPFRLDIEPLRDAQPKQANRSRNRGQGVGGRGAGGNGQPPRQPTGRGRDQRGGQHRGVQERRPRDASSRRSAPAMGSDGLPLSTGAEGLGIAAYFSGQASMPGAGAGQGEGRPGRNRSGGSGRRRGSGQRNDQDRRNEGREGRRPEPGTQGNATEQPHRRHRSRHRRPAKPVGAPTETK